MASDQQRNVTLHFFSIEVPVWYQVTDNQKAVIINEIESGGWVSVDGKRRGFLNAQHEDSIVYGYFAQEGSIRVEQYDDRQNPIEDDQDSFERILFLLYLDIGILAVQIVRISRYTDISGPILRQNLFRALGTVFHNAGIVFSGLPRYERYRELLSRGEMLSIFESHIVQEIRISDLIDRSVPDDVKLFNPNFDADKFLKSVIADDLRLVDEATWTGDDLRKTKIARAMVYAGDPVFFGGFDENGEYKEWRRSAPQEIALELNTFDVHLPEQDLRRLLDTIRQRFAAFSDRLKMINKRRNADTDDLPLFE